MTGFTTALRSRPVLMLMAALLLFTFPLRGQLAYWDFECNCSFHAIPVAPAWQEAGIVLAEARIEPPQNDNGSPDACNGADTWGTNFWPSSLVRDPNEYVEFSATALVGNDFEVESFTFYTSPSSTNSAQYFDVYYSLDGFTTETFAGSGSNGLGCNGHFVPVNTILPGGHTLSIRVYPYGQLASAGAATLRFDDVSINGVFFLPVEWARFEVKAQGEAVRLDWATTTEANNSHFELERSTDGRTFSLIGRVTGTGTSQTPREYTFMDESPHGGWNYYRIRQVDYDGQSDLSPVRAVQLKGAGNQALRLAPNPTTAFATLDLTNVKVQANDYVEVCDPAGRPVLRQAMHDRQTDLRLDMSSLPPGLYAVRLRLRDRVLSRRLVLQR